jgi:hypothetical protein
MLTTAAPDAVAVDDPQANTPAATADAERWQGWGTALKPAHEPIVLARKPLAGTVAGNVLAHGTGALNVDGCRIEGVPWTPVAPNTGGRSGGVMGKAVQHPGGEPHDGGRWPANVVLDPEAAVLLDEQTGELHSQDPATRNGGRKPDWSPSGTDRPMLDKSNPNGGDSGGASRFFFTAQTHRMEGCELASSAAASSGPDESRLGSVPSGAATEGHPEAASQPDSPLRSLEATTTVTPRRSSAEPPSDTGPIPSTDDERSPAPPPDVPTPIHSPVSGAGPSEPTGTTTTTTDPPTFDGSAGPVTSKATPPSAGRGEAGWQPLADGERFRYVAKASSAERNAGLDGFEGQFAPTMNNGIGVREHDPETATPKRNVHPTVKPIELMRWLVRLITPPGGTVLDPFAGSGTTGIACVLEGYGFIGLEREQEYAEIARARIAWWERHPEGVEIVKALEADRARQKIADSGQLGLL